MEKHDRASTQTNQILSFMQEGRSITALDALNRFGCFRLASRISDLKRQGVSVKSEFIMTEGGAKIKKYWLDS